MNKEEYESKIESIKKEIVKAQAYHKDPHALLMTEKMNDLVKEINTMHATEGIKKQELFRLIKVSLVGIGILLFGFFYKVDLTQLILFFLGGFME